MSISLKNKILFPYLVLASSITGIAQNSAEILSTPIISNIDNLDSKDVSFSNTGAKGAITKYNIDYSSVEKTSENKEDKHTHFSNILKHSQTHLSNPSFATNQSNGFQLSSINYQMIERNVALNNFSATQYTQYSHLMNLDSQISDELKSLDNVVNQEITFIRNKQELYFYSILFMLIQIGLAYSVGFFIHYKSQKTIEQRSSFLQRIYRFKSCFNSGCCAYWLNQSYLSNKQAILTKLNAIKIVSKEVLTKLELALFVANYKTITTH